MNEYQTGFKCALDLGKPTVRVIYQVVDCCDTVIETYRNEVLADRLVKQSDGRLRKREISLDIPMGDGHE